MAAKLKYNTQDFIDKAKIVHGDRYGYALTIYCGVKNKVFIYCNKHGVFEQRVSDHLAGKGCNKCGVNKSTEMRTGDLYNFINRSNIIHKNMYDYSLVKYLGSHKKVQIICPDCGIFEQTPNGHLAGKGCHKCYGKRISNSKFSDLEFFIEKATSVHGNKYDYSLVDYQGTYNTVIITCAEHGVFRQTPNNHLRGRGCSVCSNTYRHDTSSFIEKATYVHGNKYDYSSSEYVGANNKITIICKTHGIFKQIAGMHLYGRGCPGCAEYGFDRTKDGFLYVLRSECGRYMKIGVTNKPEQRQSQLSRATPFSFKRIELIEGQGDQIADLEKELLAEYQPAGFTETFDGYSEWRLWSESIRHKLISFMDKELTNGPL